MNNEKTFRTLEFTTIKQIMNEYASTEYAKEKIDAMQPFLREVEVRSAQQETSDAREMMDHSGEPPIPEVQRAKDIIEKIEKEGLLLPEQLDYFIRFVAACRRLKTYLRKAQETGSSLAWCGEQLSTLDSVHGEIVRCINGNEVDGNASQELSSIRRQMERTSNQIRSKLEEILRAKKSICSEQFIAMKNGRFTIPVKKEYKNQLSGSVIMVSSTGTTCFIEPTAAARMNEKLEGLKVEESMEVERILYQLAAMIYEKKDEVTQNIETIEMLDFAFVKGKLSSEWQAVAPMINTERRICIKKGRHPLLNRDECVPLDFNIGGEIQGIVITGPNTGGKTVTLKMVGLFSLMAQCGLHVPCESADICMNGNVLCDIGDGQNISQNLSTFSAHIMSVIQILEDTGSESLVLLDELGSGTDPAEGMGIAVSILKELSRRHCLFVATTHYVEVKKYAEEAVGLQNARMTFDRETLNPEYRLVIGEAGESCALYIAKKLGFPTVLLNEAYEQTYHKKAENMFINEGESPKIDNKIVSSPKIQKIKKKKEVSEHALSFCMGDSVEISPENKIGIVYQPTDEEGYLIVQVQGEKVRVNHKRIHLKASAASLYPEDYDFSILFESVEVRKAKHNISRKYVKDLEIKVDN